MPNKFEFPAADIQSKQRSPKQPISMKHGSKFVGHSTEIIWQSKIKEPLKYGKKIALLDTYHKISNCQDYKRLILYS